ncbi:MAG: hypothetical protein RL701_1575 [Pseudomonadota bacterium]
MRTARPRSLPLAPHAAPARRHLPLAAASRPVDGVRPIYAVWEITLACDLACRHCGSRAGRARPDELTTAECVDLVRQMAELGVREITLIGGEAYLRADWLEIVRAIAEHGMTPTMTSGGRGIDAELARAARAAGLAGVSISVDGLTATHDRLRGVAGSHAHALAALEHLHAAGIPVTVNSQIKWPCLFTARQCRVSRPVRAAVLAELAEWARLEPLQAEAEPTPRYRSPSMVRRYQLQAKAAWQARQVMPISTTQAFPTTQARRTRARKTPAPRASCLRGADSHLRITDSERAAQEADAARQSTPARRPIKRARPLPAGGCRWKGPRFTA